MENDWKIFIIRTEKGWICDMSEARNNEEIKKIFGTYLLSSPYSKNTNVEYVLWRLAELNPLHVIIDTKTSTSQTSI